MNTLKNFVRAVLASGLLILGLGAVEKAQALNNPDTMVITVQPDATYAVAITSPEVQGYDFGLVAVAGTTISTMAIGVQNTGNIVEFFSLGVIDTTLGAGVAWTNNGASLAAGTTSYVMQGRFVATAAGQPAFASFNGAANNIPVAPPSPADSKFGQGTGLAGKTTPGSSKDLWLRLHMPTAVYESGVHTLVLSVNGQNL